MSGTRKNKVHYTWTICRYANKQINSIARDLIYCSNSSTPCNHACTCMLHAMHMSLLWSLPPFSVSMPGSCSGDCIELSELRDRKEDSDARDLMERSEVRDFIKEDSEVRLEGMSESHDLVEVSEMREFMLLILSLTDIVLTLVPSRDFKKGRNYLIAELKNLLLNAPTTEAKESIRVYSLYSSIQ